MDARARAGVRVDDAGDLDGAGDVHGRAGPRVVHRRPLRRSDQEPGARLRARRGGRGRLRAVHSAHPQGVSGVQQLDVSRAGRSLAAAVDGALRGRGGAAADPDDADGRDAAAAGAPLRHAALGAAALGPAHRHALRDQPVRRGRGRVLRRLRVPAAHRRHLDQRHRGVVQPDAGGGDHRRAPPHSRRRQGRRRRRPPRSGWTTAAVEAHLEGRRCRPARGHGARAPRRDGRLRRLGRDRDDAAGAVDAVAGDPARVVGVLVHADPARVPDRPRRRRRGVRAPQPADAASGPVARGAAPRDRRGGRRDVPVHRPGALRLHLAAAVVQLRRRRDAVLPVRARLHHGAAGDAADGRRLPADRARGDGRPRLGRPRRRQRLRAEHRRRDRRVFPVGVLRAAPPRPREGHLRRGAVRPGAGGDAVPGGARPAAPPPPGRASPPPSRSRCSAW